MLGTGLRCNLMTSHFLSLSAGMLGHFLIFPVYAVVLSILVFNVWLPKRKKTKYEARGERNTGSFKSPERHFSQRGRGLQQCRGGGTVMAACLLVCTSVIRCNNQPSEHRSLIFRGIPFCPPWLL